MNLVSFYSPEKNLEEEAINHVQAPIYEPLQSPHEGSELPRSAVHAKDHLIMFTEECIAAGCPDNLW